MIYSGLLYGINRIKAGLLLFCTMLFCAVNVMAQSSIIYYVSPQGGGDKSGSSWENTTTFADALSKAKAGDQIWLQGFEQITDAEQHLYVAPVEGWTIPSGVKVYGGFEGKEPGIASSINNRATLGKAYQMKYRSVLSGDRDGKDEIHPDNTIFPKMALYEGNTSREDNATHVLVMNAFSEGNNNDNSYPTVVDGLTIIGGHADGEGENGGGIYVKGDVNNSSVPYSIDRCYFLNNYGNNGGAVYVDASVKEVATKSLINQCVVYNNVAGTLVGKENVGGGIYIAGAGNIVNSSIFNNENGGVVLSANAYLVNSTVARNTGGGVDMNDEDTGDEAHVFNSVVWGNSYVFAGIEPIFKFSAYPGADEANTDNLNVSTDNQGDAKSPRFDAPSLKTSFDTEYDWRRTAYPLWSWKLLEGSYLINKGNNAYYNTYAYGYNGVVGTELGGENRIMGDAIDINSYEFQTIPSARIRYVKTDGNDNADGLSWGTAYKSVQKAINELAKQPGVPGEVWVAKGEYEPTEYIAGNGTPTSFRMYDGISLYGGFAGTETTKSERDREASDMPWYFANKTVLRGNTYSGDNTWNSTDNKWSLASASTHVVWFAPLNEGEEFQNTTVIEGFTIEGGQAKVSEALNYNGDKGAGVYMSGANVYLINSVVKDNVAPSEGGGIYLKNGRVQGCLVYNNSSETKGGGIYVDNAGLVLRSMIVNNSAPDGGAVYLDNKGVQADGMLHPEYLILSTSVVSNNTSVNNGAVYCNNGGIILQSTIVNNSTPTATDNASDNASQTAGLYIDSYAKVVNSVLWENRINGINTQLYAKNPSAENVQFHYNAVANMNGIIWNNTLQEELIELSETNEAGEGTMAPGFSEGYPTEPNNQEVLRGGVQGDWTEIDYFWKPITGANLRARGMSLGMLPADVLLAPELDVTGTRFAQKPAVGAYAVEQPAINPEDGGTYLRIYVDVDCAVPDHDGSSWEKGYRSLNEAIDYMSKLTSAEVGNKELEIYVMEGDAWPRYASVNLDPKSATIEVPKMASGKKLTIKGGYSRENHDTWAPLTYRTQINGNHEGKVQEEGLYHCITVEKDAIVEFDGLHVINGYAASTANLKYGAGMLVRAGANVTVKNSIFENNTAVEGAAIDAREATLTLVNCVVNNNTNTDDTKQIVNAQTLIMNHVTVVNNKGVAPANIGTNDNSFAAGNVAADGVNTANKNNTLLNGSEITVSSANFVNPTLDKGATLGYKTYIGGYSSFMPTNACPVVNMGESTAGLDKDITGVDGSRSRGGAPDLGAYEAELPIDGTVVYVRQGGTGDQSGSSWNNACATIGAALAKAVSGKEIWVSAGTYIENLDMKDGVNVLGGFAATGSPTNKIDGVNRDISHKYDNFKTIIQGNSTCHFIPEQKIPDESNYNKNNNRRVLTQPSNFDKETLWEGFVIKGGQTGLAEYGAGVNLMIKGHLKNCRIEGNKFYECGKVVYQELGLGWKDKNTYCSHDATNHTGGGGVYCAGGIIENCQIVNNVLDGFKFDIEIAWNQRYVSDGNIYGKGAGLSISGGSIINCVIAQNVAGYDPVLNPNPDGGALTNILGAAAFVQSQSNFYSSTIVENTGGWSGMNRPIIPGIWDEALAGGDGSYFYNCIIIGNYGYGSTKENFMQIGKGLNQVPKNLMYSYFSVVKFSDGSQTPAESALASDRYNKYKDFGSGYQPGDINKYTTAYNSLNLLTDDFELNIQNGTHPCLNTGSEEYLYNTDQNIHIIQDANGYDRIQDCAVDMGAYESANETNLAYETTTVDGKTLITYYVNESGAGLRNGSSVTNAACAMKLQQILTHAGQTAKGNPEADVVVKVAGYKTEYIYHANTLSNSEDPQSYTYVIPYGVTVMGGYNGLANDWSDENRNPKLYRTILSAKNNSAALEQEVNGYHTVTFGEKPSDWTGGDKTTIIDGLYLIDGKATSMAGEGNPNTRGGGATVPAWAHVRNCVVAQCEAIQGGGLYLMPGATVSGTLVIANNATDGAGIYADNEGIDEDDVEPLRSHVISCTITDNTAKSDGGGMYLEDGAVLTTNSVIFGNNANSNKNVSGAVALTFKDTRFANVVGDGTGIEEFYPFNHCYVETYEMPSNYENTAMVSDEDLYFTADRTLKAYSELVKHGTKNYDGLLKEFGIAEKDMQGIARKQDASERMDVGAYAFNGGIIPLPKSSTDPVVKKIFVNQGSINVTAEENMDDLIGRTFYTPVSWLDDALEYIGKVREVSGLEGTDFEIYLAGGTYKPSNRRTEAASPVVDQRQNSFVIPEGVKIYGGFSGEEKFSYGTNITVSGVEGVFVDITDRNTDLLNERGYSDLNNNSILEPWEFANQTIFSGDINVSTEVKNAYHVVYSSVKENQVKGLGVLLDGITIKDGETSNNMSATALTDEIGRGGAIYTNGVNYTLNGCRVMNSKAVRGGAIYSRDADMTIIGSVIGGNGTVDNPQTENGQDVRGGAIYMSAYNESSTLRAINTLWANNETTGKGGAIATSNDIAGYNGKVTVSLMNNTIVRNKANECSAVYSTSDGTITNTVMWGGEGNGVVSSGLTINYSASDAELTGDNNVKLSATNMAIDGPRFAAPSQAAGLAANSVASKWNPASISLLTDAGNGKLDYKEEDVTKATGAYKEWWTGTAYDGSFYTKDVNYKRYKGPAPLPGETPQPMKIDIGMFEYQYKTTFSMLDDIYVDTQERGDGSGKSWDDATSDLRGAIIALSDPDGGSKTDKTIHIRGGEYMQSQLYVGNIAYQARLNGNNENLASLTIKGSYAENRQQDFSQPTVFKQNDAKTVETMFYAQTNGKTLNIEGVTFQGATTAGLDADNSGTLNLKNVAFRGNGTGAVVENTGEGKALFANTLFADGTTGLKTAGSNVTVVNATFANNATAAVDGSATIYNTVAWNSGAGVNDEPDNGNINLEDVANDNILEGPNFMDPDNEDIMARNYMIRPSISLIDAAKEGPYNELLGDNASTTDKDLGNNARKTGDGMDIGAYEYNAALQQVVYVKSNVAMTDGSGKSWENPIKDLQGAIDLASIYANKNSNSNGYVFVHSDVKDAQDIRLNMPNVKVYGGMNDEVAADIESLINARSEILSDNMTTVNGLTLSGASNVMDGFKVTGEASVTNGMLSTSVIENATVGTNGIVYNSYVSGSLTGEGKAVNVTSPKAIGESVITSNVFENAVENNYVTSDIWKYQLKETDLGIDNRNAEDVKTYMDMAGHSKDLSGSPRVRNTVDAGCFETWNITSNTTLTAAERPTDKHVVYVRKGVEADIAEGLYPEGTNFNVGFLLLEHGAGLRSNGNAVKLTNFAVERNLDEDNNRWDMCYMPFEIVNTEVKQEGTEGVSVKTYDGEARAAYDYKFSSEDGAWKVTGIQGGIGMLMQSGADAKVRMYGNNYTETAGTAGRVQLMKYNNMQPWDSSNSGTSQKFTHLENMSWNMFGSPFLCAMNYSDMEYGRIFYEKDSKGFATVDATGNKDGSIEAGSAVLTQTATLQTSEIFAVNQRKTEKAGYSVRGGNLAVAIAKADSTAEDEIALMAVPADEASEEFMMNRDGVKMMSVDSLAAQIYMTRSGKQYSLLSALNIEGYVNVDVVTPEAGMYSLFIPDYCSAEDYETVVLKDNQTGRVVDLLEGGYTFNTDRGGSVEGRFSIAFNRDMAENAASDITVTATGNGRVRVSGLAEGHRVYVYNEAGVMITNTVADGYEMNISVQRGIRLVRVVDANGSETVRKVAVR